MRLGGALRSMAGIALAVLLLAWVLRGVDLAAIGDRLRGTAPAGLAAAMVLNFLHNIFRVWRWRALLAPVRPGVPFRPMFSAVVLGYLTSWTVPGRLGELVRPALLASRERLPLGPCLGTVVADRLLDGVTVLGLFAVGMATTPLSAGLAREARWIRAGSLGIVVAIAVPLAVLLLATRHRERLGAWAAGRRGVRPWLGRAVLSVAGGIEALRRPRLLVRIGLHSAAAWLIVVAALWVGLRACGAAVAFSAVLVILPLLVLGIALPTPGGAGGYHAAMAFGLSRLYDVDPAVAVGAGFVMHAAVVLPVIVVGVALLAFERMPFRDLLDAGRAAATLGAADSRRAEGSP